MHKKILTYFLICSLFAAPCSALAANESVQNNTEIKTETNVENQNTEVEDSTKAEESSTNVVDGSLEESASTSLENATQPSFADMDLDELSKLNISTMSNAELGDLAMSPIFSQYYSNKNISGTNNQSFSELFSEITGRDISQESMFNTSLFGTGLDMGMVNLQYDAMVANLQGQKTDVSGQSGTAMDVFNNSYGDLADKIKIKKATIPKGFNPEKMLKQTSKSINKSYNNVMKKDSNFKIARANLNVSGIFNQAKNGVTTYSLDSADSLKKSISKDVANMKGDMEGEYNSNKSAIDWDYESTEGIIAQQQAKKARIARNQKDHYETGLSYDIGEKVTYKNKQYTYKGNGKFKDEKGTTWKFSETEKDKNGNPKGVLVEANKKQKKKEKEEKNSDDTISAVRNGDGIAGNPKKVEENGETFTQLPESQQPPGKNKGNAYEDKWGSVCEYDPDTGKIVRNKDGVIMPYTW